MTNLVLTYNLQNLQQEVEKRTSYLGSMRATDNTPHLLNRVALTKGEAFLYEEYLLNTLSEIIAYLQPWIRNKTNPYIIYPDAPIHTVKHDLGAYGTLENQYFCKGAPLKLTNVQPNDNFTITIHNGKAIIVGLKITICYTSYIPDTPVVNSGIIESSVLPLSFPQENSMLTDNGSWNLNLNLRQTELGNEELKSIEWVQLETEASLGQSYSNLSANKGEYVIEQHIMLEQQCYLLTDNWQEGIIPLQDVAVPFEENYINAIVFNFDMPNWWNNAMLNTAKRQLRESLVNGIIAQWLEFVLPEEAQTFALKTQSAIENVVVALNAENKPLKRNYRMF